MTCAVGPQNPLRCHSFDLGGDELKAVVNVTARLGAQRAEQPLALTVKKVLLPSFMPAATVILQPRASAFVDLTIDRNDYLGPLELRVENRPRKLTSDSSLSQ